MKLLFAICITFSGVLHAQELKYDYQFFTNSRMSGNYFFSHTSAVAPSVISNHNNRLPVSETIFHTPGNSLKLQYVNGKTGRWSAAIYKPSYRGQDQFKPARFFSFSIYVASASVSGDNLPSFRFIKEDSSFSEKQVFAVTRIHSWQRISIPVNFNNPSAVIGIEFLQNGYDGNAHILYIDDIEFEENASSRAVQVHPANLSARGYAKHIDLSWDAFTDTAVRYIQIYRSRDGLHFKPVGIQSRRIARYTDFTGVTGKKYYYKISFLNDRYIESSLSGAVSATTRPMTDDELLTMVQEACFRYYWEGAEKTSGLAKENILGRENMIAAGASGFGIMALIAGTERKFISRQQAVERFRKIVDFLMQTETFHGAYPHFTDGPSKKAEPFFGERDNGGDLVETAFLMQGLIAARAYFNQPDGNETYIRNSISTIWNKVEWDWYRRYADSKFLYWHWSPNQAWVINHRLIGWNETMVTYLLAIASPSHAVPASLYYSGWANQDSTGKQYRSGWGGTMDGSMYANGKKYFNIKLDVGVSNGGPLFFTQYSYLGYDPHLITDKYTNYFTNNQHIARINYAYCKTNPLHYKGYGEACWGLTASDGPYDYSASEPVESRDQGKIAPTGAIAAFPYTPTESMKALKNYYYNYGHFLWGEFGFRDAFSLNENWCSEIYMGLNQAPMAVMIENYRSGLLWKLFMSDADIKNGMDKLNKETKSE